MTRVEFWVWRVMDRLSLVMHHELKFEGDGSSFVCLRSTNDTQVSDA